MVRPKAASNRSRTDLRSKALGHKGPAVKAAGPFRLMAADGPAVGPLTVGPPLPLVLDLNVIAGGAKSPVGGLPHGAGYLFTGKAVIPTVIMHCSKQHSESIVYLECRSVTGTRYRAKCSQCDGVLGF